MQNSFKFSTFVLKLMIFSFLIASFALSSVRAAELSENEKMVMGKVRLSLWYTGLESSEKPSFQGNPANIEQVEELSRAMDRYQSEVEKPYLDAKRD